MSRYLNYPYDRTLPLTDTERAELAVDRSALSIATVMFAIGVILIVVFMLTMPDRVIVPGALTGFGAYALVRFRLLEARKSRDRQRGEKRYLRGTLRQKVTFSRRTTAGGRGTAVPDITSRAMRIWLDDYRFDVSRTHAADLREGQSLEIAYAPHSGVVFDLRPVETIERS